MTNFEMLDSNVCPLQYSQAGMSMHFLFGNRKKNLRNRYPGYSIELLAVSHEFTQCSYNSLIQTVLESDLDHCTQPCGLCLGK